MDSQINNISRILAIDYGEKRIGIAVSDPLKIFAIPLKTIKNDDKLWVNFKKILNENNVEKVICGYPLKENDSKTELTVKVEKFSVEFKERFDFEIEFVDERYSSSIAWEHILESVPSRKKRKDKSLIDKKAAAVILSDFINKQE